MLDQLQLIADNMGWPTVFALSAVLAGFAWAMVRLYIDFLRDSRILASTTPRNLVSGTADPDTYGIRILSPQAGAETTEHTVVTGSYKKAPPHGSLRLFVVHSNGGEFWPQQVITDFDRSRHTWSSFVTLGGNPRYRATIAVALVGQPTQVLWDYFHKVDQMTKWKSIDGWPDDSHICDQVSVTRT